MRHRVLKAGWLIRAASRERPSAPKEYLLPPENTFLPNPPELLAGERDLELEEDEGRLERDRVLGREGPRRPPPFRSEMDLAATANLDADVLLEPDRDPERVLDLVGLLVLDLALDPSPCSLLVKRGVYCCRYPLPAQPFWQNTWALLPTYAANGSTKSG